MGHHDSVIYALGGERFAIVLLTWARVPEQPPLPQAVLFTSRPDALGALGEHIR